MHDSLRWLPRYGAPAERRSTFTVRVRTKDHCSIRFHFATERAVKLWWRILNPPISHGAGFSGQSATASGNQRFKDGAGADSEYGDGNYLTDGGSDNGSDLDRRSQRG